MTEDFSKPLDVNDYPIMRLMRTQKRLSRYRIGMYEPKTNKPKVFEVNGEPINDKRTGEFLGGVVSLKDVTEYVDSLRSEKKKNVQQLADIATCVPIMVWTNTPDGMPDWFSPRWYNYTGLTEEESLGEAWVTPFHPDDREAAGARWAHSIATGVRVHTRD